jgi:hypothetical protein
MCRPAVLVGTGASRPDRVVLASTEVIHLSLGGTRIKSVASHLMTNLTVVVSDTTLAIELDAGDCHGFGRTTTIPA